MKINIIAPCHENWDEMTANEQGRFCDACQKTVIDFSKMSDLEIYHALHNHKGKICGRLTLQQIENFNAAHEYFPSPSNIKKWSLAAALAGVLAYPSLSQPEVNFQNALASVMPVLNTNLEQNASSEIIDNPVDSIVLEGKVVRKANGLELTHATVQIEGTNISVQTDHKGHFKISIPSSKEKIVLTAYCDDYHSNSISINAKSKSNLVIALEIDKRRHHIMGGISADYFD